MHYYKYGFDYYLIGRKSFFLGGLSVAESLFHHAVEMTLKSCIIAAIPIWEEGELVTLHGCLKGIFSHNLGSLFGEVRSLYPNISSEFQATINDLNDWESIRYPSLNAQRSVSADTQESLSEVIAIMNSLNQEPTQRLSLESVDKLMFSLAQPLLANKENYIQSWLKGSPELREIYLRGNKFPSI